MTGEVTEGTVNIEDEPCHTKKQVTKIHKKVKIHWFRSPTNLLMFTNWMHWEECMEMCPKYQRARGVSFSDQGGMEELGHEYLH